MRYMIAHMFTGEVREFHLSLSNELAERFKLTPVSKRIDPHLTLKAPFETDDTSELEALLEAFCTQELPQPFVLDGIGDFEGRVVYMEADAPKETHMLIRRLQDKLRHIPWMSFSKLEFPVTLHATLCYPKNEQHGKEVCAYLKKQKIPSFPCSLNSASLLMRTPERWEVARTYEL